MTSIDSAVAGMFERLERMFTRGLARLLVRVERQVAATVSQTLYTPRGPYLNRVEAREYLGHMPRPTFDQKVASGDIRACYPVVGLPMFTAADLDAYAHGEAIEDLPAPTPITNRRAA